MRIVIVDYGVGNTSSIQNMLAKCGQDSLISSNEEEIATADKLILPGVGSFDTGMSKLKSLNLIEVLNQKVLIDKVPILGICLGMQLLGLASEEGELNGLSWIHFKSKHLSKITKELKVPHMGWNFVNKNSEHPLLADLDETSRFYFVHSYYADCEKMEDTMLTAHYGESFTCAVFKENIAGVQFHPEKSHKFGLKLFRNFVSWDGSSC